MKKSFTRNLFWLFLAMTQLLALGGCGGPRADIDDQVADYRRSEGYVRLEAIEPGAPANTHPYIVSPDVLRRLLGDMKAGREAVFANEELDVLAPALASVFAKASPQQDVTFGVPGSHGLLGSYSRRTVTTGRAFVRDGKLNVIFGTVHDFIDKQTWENPGTTLPGSRKQRLEPNLTLAPGLGKLASNERGDWVVFDVAALPPAATTPATTAPATPATPETAGKSKDIEEKLRTLKRLKEDGLITEDEYQDKRRAILQAF